MAIKIAKTWRKATDEELKNGSSEMILAEETQYEEPEVVKEKINLADIDVDTMTPQELQKLANKLKPLLK